MEAASYDLLIGDEYYVSSDDKPEGISKLSPDAFAWIPPNAICTVLSEQVVNMPDDVAGSISLPLGLLKQGLIMPPQTQVDPGYSGKIAVLLYNLSNRYIKLRRGDHLITIEFRFLDEPTERPYPKVGGYYGLNSLSKIVVSPLTSSLHELRRDIDKWQNRLTTFVPLVLTVVTITVASLALLLAILVGRAAFTGGLFKGPDNGRPSAAANTADQRRASDRPIASTRVPADTRAPSIPAEPAASSSGGGKGAE